MTLQRPLSGQTGASMIEILVTMVVLAFGLLGLAGLIVQGQRAEMESYQRVQAMILLQDIYQRINTNRVAAASYAYTNATTGRPFLGCQSASCPFSTAPNPPIASPAATQVDRDLQAWHDVLQGAAERASGVTASGSGAMVGARGCISYDGTNLLNDSTGAAIPGTGLYTVSIAWQGMGNTFANTNLLCGTGQYDNEANRRVVSLTFRIGAINNTQ